MPYKAYTIYIYRIYHITGCLPACVACMPPLPAAITRLWVQSPFLLRNFADCFADSALIFSALNLQFFHPLPCPPMLCFFFHRVQILGSSFKSWHSLQWLRKKALYKAAAGEILKQLMYFPRGTLLLLEIANWKWVLAGNSCSYTVSREVHFKMPFIGHKLSKYQRWNSLWTSLN